MPHINIHGTGEVDVAPEFLALPGDQQDAMIQQYVQSRAAPSQPTPTSTTMRAPNFYRPEDYQAVERQLRSIGDSAGGATSLADLQQVSVQDQRGPQTDVSSASRGTITVRPHGLASTGQQVKKDPPAQFDTDPQHLEVAVAPTAYMPDAIALVPGYTRPHVKTSRAPFDKISSGVDQPRPVLDGAKAGTVAGMKRVAGTTIGVRPQQGFGAVSVPPRKVTGKPGEEAVGTSKDQERNSDDVAQARKDLAFLESESASYMFQNYVKANPSTHLHTPDNSISVVASGPITPTASGGYITSSTVHAYIGGEFKSYTPTERGGGAISVTPVYSGGTIVDFTITDYVSN